MKTNTNFPHITVLDGAYLVVGNFEFNVTHPAMDDRNIPYVDISFTLCPEIPQDRDLDNSKVIELLAEKLKQDFIKFNNKP